MVLGVVGISYREATLKKRERIIEYIRAFDKDRFLTQRLLGRGGTFISLITCHRVEIYYYSKTPEITQLILASSFASRDVQPYCYRDIFCFNHLFHVTSGIESLILGETEIQGQVKRAYLKASAQRQLPFDLHFLFQKALKEGKNFRSQTPIPLPGISIESVVQETLHLHDKSVKSNLLFIGYSDINRRVAKSLYREGYRNITFCSRQKLAIPYPVLPRHTLSFHYPYDIIFFGSSESQKHFNELSLDNLISIPERIVFDFNVPRTFSWKEQPRGFVCLDMDFISECLQRRIQSHAQDTNKVKLSLTFAAEKQWEVYQKKSSYLFQNQVQAAHINSALSC
ncbi:glutamyl-tRNA reductase [Candidatus Chlamydia sanziniae]|nr:glutamyl-tRNA reductase [Candidatus Chlamydia sanziniae]